MPVSGVYAKRRVADLDKLRELERMMPGVLNILGVSGNPPETIRLRINLPTASSSSYPTLKQLSTEVEISFPERYPFHSGPIVMVKTPVWNPNIYSSGKWCYGEHWNPTENLGLFIQRFMKVLALDPTIINPQSAANREAAQWYMNKRRTNPGLFPTVSLNDLMKGPQKSTIGWKTIK